ncbi:MAG TPA: aminotransferase class V-fold PLP-dependent enzyme [Cyclobacteriaceae bacterium]
MIKVSFYPGPSRVYSNIPEYIYEAYMNNIVSLNHRSEEFTSLVKETKKILKTRLSIPRDYEIVFVSSATECWEIIAQSLASKLGSYHIFNGAFGHKWYDYTTLLNINCEAHRYDLQELPSLKKISIPSDNIVCLTQNETSNGTQVTTEIIGDLRSDYPENLIAVDATSSMAGIKLPFKLADIWYASVQKCFGLPAGLAVMILSPNAIQKTLEINESSHYNSLSFVLKNSRLMQTHHTPNVLDIYLLMRTQKASKGIAHNHKKVTDRYEAWKELLDNQVNPGFLIKNEKLRSRTVITLIMDKESKVKEIKNLAKEAGFILGNGYGDLKSNTFRIANFPALKTKEIQQLQNFISRNYD